MPRGWKITALGLALAWIGSISAPAQEPVSGGAVGIRVTPVSVDPETLTAEFDLTMYTRSGPNATVGAGAPSVAIPALDFGDGSTLSTTLLLHDSDGGPGGSAVYRSAASLSHTFPSPATYVVTAGMACESCSQSQGVWFPVGSPPPTAYTTGYDFLPATVIGDLAATERYSGTYTSLFGFSALRYAVTIYGAVTNTARVTLPLTGVAGENIPTLHPIAIGVLGLLFASLGWWLLRT